MPLLTNLVVLGQGAPNQLQDGRQSVCVCAWSLDTNSFHRIYPVPLGWLRKWDLFDVEVETNPQDHRENTWKIKNSNLIINYFIYFMLISYGRYSEAIKVKYNYTYI